MLLLFCVNSPRFQYRGKWPEYHDDKQKIHPAGSAHALSPCLAAAWQFWKFTHILYVLLWYPSANETLLTIIGK